MDDFDMFMLVIVQESLRGGGVMPRTRFTHSRKALVRTIGTGDRRRKAKVLLVFPPRTARIIALRHLSVYLGSWAALGLA